MAEQIKDSFPSLQQLVIETFLCHPTMKGWLPPYLVDITKLKQSQHILGNLKDELTFHLVGQRQFNIILAKDIVCILAASSQPVKSNRGIARLLRVDKQNIKKGMDKKLLLDMQNDAF